MDNQRIIFSVAVLFLWKKYNILESIHNKLKEAE